MMVHLPLHLATVGVAVGVAKVITGEETRITPEVIPYLTVPLVIVLVCMAVLESLSGDRGPDRVALAAIMVGAALVGRRVRAAA